MDPLQRKKKQHQKNTNKSKYLQSLKQKQEGNKLYKTKEYSKALMRYNLAIQQCPVTDYKNLSILYANAAASFIGMKQYQNAIKDCNISIKYNSTYLKAYYRRSIAYQHIGQYNKALNDYNNMLTIEKDIIQQTKFKKTIQKLKDLMITKEELQCYGYLRETNVFSFPLIISIIINYFGRFLDLNFDQNTPNKDCFIFNGKKKIQKKQTDRSQLSICLMDKIITSDICKTFKISIKINWTMTHGVYCRIGYLTKDINQSIISWNSRVMPNALGGKKTNKYQYGIEFCSLRRKYINLWHEAVIPKKELKSSQPYTFKSGDIFSLFYSFEKQQSILYINNKRIGICFDSKSIKESITKIIPVVSLYSFNMDKSNANYGSMEIIDCVLNCSE